MRLLVEISHVDADIFSAILTGIFVMLCQHKPPGLTAAAHARARFPENEAFVLQPGGLSPSCKNGWGDRTCPPLAGSKAPKAHKPPTA